MTVLSSEEQEYVARVRDRVDPDRAFTNAYLDRVLGG